jgi:hypothetical protein
MASLSEFADRGQIVPEFSDETIRELLVAPYRAVYRVSSGREGGPVPTSRDSSLILLFPRGH